MRRIADLYPGEGKTDARDAYVIADAARTLPHALRLVGPDEQATVELAVLAGYDADLADESTRLINRLHDALSHVHPGLNGCWASPRPPRRPQEPPSTTTVPAATSTDTASTSSPPTSPPSNAGNKSPPSWARRHGADAKRSGPPTLFL
jgi:hypothetical protein